MARLNLRVLVAIGVVLSCGAVASPALAHPVSPALTRRVSTRHMRRARAGPARRARTRLVRYHGLPLRIPRSWPVVDLSRDPYACVRFDRHALYLGTPSPEERCPARAIGRTEALLVQPLAARARGLAPSGDATTFVVRSAGVRVTATWSRAPGVVARALGRRSLVASSPARPRDSNVPVRRTRKHLPIYTGLGFDVCRAPTTRQMSKWLSSPYRAIGIYLGGVNEGCSQPNLSSTWVSTETAAGWHLVPLYVGLQAPVNGCGCAPISTKAKKAHAEGAAAAADAVAQAQRLGIPAGYAIYDDMEGYYRDTSNTRSVLAFLASWTTTLHSYGYLSGVYSDAKHGMRDLAAQYGTNYPEPDDIWFADWNGAKTIKDRYFPSTDWVDHQRIHQYSGAVDQTYHKVTLAIDGDYLDGAL